MPLTIGMFYNFASHRSFWIDTRVQKCRIGICKRFKRRETYRSQSLPKKNAVCAKRIYSKSNCTWHWYYWNIYDLLFGCKNKNLLRQLSEWNISQTQMFELIITNIINYFTVFVLFIKCYYFVVDMCYGGKRRNRVLCFVFCLLCSWFYLIAHAIM